MPQFHKYTNGLHTASQAFTVDAVRITGLNVTVGQLCTVAEDAGAGLINTVTHTATGVYTFQLSQPFPPRLVVCSPEISSAGPTSAILTARYQNASYNSTTGQFIVNVSNATPAAADGGAADELHVTLNFHRYKNS